MKKLTSFTHFKTGEGDRISFTYSEIKENGELLDQNNKGNFIVLDDEVQNQINAIEQFITENYLRSE